MIPIIKGSTGSEAGLLALLDLIANPSKIPEVKATLKELVKARDEGATSLAKANELNAFMEKTSKEVSAREAALTKMLTQHELAAAALVKDKATHEAAVKAFREEKVAWDKQAKDRTNDLNTRANSLQYHEGEVAKRESHLIVNEKAAAALKIEYEARLAEFRKLAGVG